MPIGAEYMSEKELRSLYGNHNFSLGWWSVVQPRPTSVGTVEDEQHEEQKYGMRLLTFESMNCAHAHFKVCWHV